MMSKNEFYYRLLNIGKESKNLEIVGTRITVGAGYSLMKLALRVSRMGLTGL